MEDREQHFAALVLETIARRAAGLGHWWAERARLATPGLGDPDSDGDGTGAGRAAEQLVRTLLDAVTDDGAHRAQGGHPVMRAGAAIGVEAHRRHVSLYQMLKELDLLAAAVLRTAEQAAAELAAGGNGGTGQEGLVVARRIAAVTSLLRLAAAKGYTRAAERELREHYRVLRHDLRNPLGTIKSAIALLTDESVPPELRQSLRVRAMVARNASSLDRMIGEALGDAAACLRAFGTPGEVPAEEAPPLAPADRPASGREQRDDVVRRRQRPDLESGAL